MGGAGSAAYYGYAPAPAAPAHGMHAHAMDTSDAHISHIPTGPGEVPPGVYDVDAADAADPSCVSEYAREIYLNQRHAEVRHMSAATLQRLADAMRSIAIGASSSGGPRSLRCA